jgi:hypothetical protein
LLAANIKLENNSLPLYSAFVERAMNETITNPRLAALVSAVLFLPFVVTFTIPWLNIAPFDQQMRTLFTDSGGGGLNGLGFVVMFGGLVLVPVAFIVNLTSMITKRSLDARRALRFPRPANLILGCSMLLTMVMIAFLAATEAYNCTNGVCD